MSLLLDSCGDESLSFEILVQNLPADARSLEVTTRLNGESSHEGPLLVTRRLDRFSLQVPAAARGILRVHASALRDDTCAVASAELRLKLGYPGKLLDPTEKDDPDLLLGDGHGVALLMNAEPEPCSISVKFSGQGNQTIKSTPPGISCTYSCDGASCRTAGSCSQVFPAGKPVDLAASGKDFSSLNNWLGACTGKGACSLTVGGERKTVTAEVTPQKNCTTTSWCDADLLPCGGEVTAVWVNSATDYYVARKNCGLWNFNGTAWSRVVVPAADMTNKTITSIWSDGNENVWAVGEDGFFLHIKKPALAAGISNRFYPSPSDLKKSFHDVIGISVTRWYGGDDNREVAVALAVSGEPNNGVLYLIDENERIQPAQAMLITIYGLNKIWTDWANDWWLGGDHGRLYHGSSLDNFKEINTGYDESIVDISGMNRSDIWFLTRPGRLLHYDGSFFTDVKLDKLFPAKCVVHSMRSTVAGEVWLSLGVSGGPAKLYRLNLAAGITAVDPPIAGEGYCNDSSAWHFAGSSREQLWTRTAVWQQGHANLWQRNMDSWQPVPSAGAPNLVSVAGNSAEDLWLLSDQGEVFRRNQRGLAVLAELATVKINALWYQSADNVWMVGKRGAVYHYDGSRVTQFPAVTNVDLYAVYGTGYDNLWIGGEGKTLLHWDGNSWTHVPVVFTIGPADSPPANETPDLLTGAVSSIIGNPVGDEFFIMVAAETAPRDIGIARRDGEKFNIIGFVGSNVIHSLSYENDGLWINESFHFSHFKQPSQSEPVVHEVYAAQPFQPLSQSPCLIWSDRFVLYSTCQVSSLMSSRYAIQQVDIGTKANLRAIWGRESDIWAVGDQGAILRYNSLRSQ